MKGSTKALLWEVDILSPSPIMSLNAHPDVEFLAGPMFWGNLFGYGLYGILIVQTFIYFHRFRKDPIHMQTLVWTCIFLETLLVIFGTVAGNNILVSGWGTPAALGQLDWALGGTPLLTGLVATSAQSFYCWRIHKLRRLIVIPLVLIIVSLLTSGLAAYSGIQGHRIGILRINELRPYVLIWIFGATSVDASITICMVTILLQAYSKSSFHETSSIIQKLIALTIETSMVTVVMGITHAVLYIVFSDNNLHFMTFLILAKIYSNSLLATLNARALIGQQDIVRSSAFWADAIGSQSHVSRNPRPFTLPHSVIPGSGNLEKQDSRVELQVETVVFPNNPEPSSPKFRQMAYHH